MGMWAQVLACMLFCLEMNKLQYIVIAGWAFAGLCVCVCFLMFAGARGPKLA